ncbi:MAG TPA: glycoside hydrolase family 43 protein [Opitutaceae bacterium]|nr:glycoside hydrolase family 43 protein [Opitutaceae bacterium]
MHYKNPVWSGYLADPFVLRYSGTYYAYGTGSDEGFGRQADGNVFPVLRSTDLVNWTLVGGALVPYAAKADMAYWSPEVAEREGKFYMYYAADGRLRVAVADRPEGPFVDRGRDLFPDEPFTIDANPFRDPKDGKWYLFFAKDFFDERVGTGTAVVPLGDDMMTPLEKPRVVVRASSDWHIYEKNRAWYGKTWPAWHTVEGPFVVAHNGRYYCLYSGGSWQTPNYGVSYAVADHPLGPYTDEWSSEGPAVLRGIPGVVLGPGHNSVVLGPDGVTLYVVYHAWDPAKTARRMCIDPLVWTENGPRCAGPTT